MFICAVNVSGNICAVTIAGNMYLYRNKARASTHMQNAEVNIFVKIQHKLITILLVIHSKRGYIGSGWVGRPTFLIKNHQI
jgi:hypothetical protein